MRTFHVSLLFCLLAGVVVQAEDPNSAITIGGVTYENYHWGTVTPTTVSIFHKTGVATIPLEKLPADLQKQFGYNPQKVAESKAVEYKAEAPPASAKSPPPETGRKHAAEDMQASSGAAPRFPAVIVFENKSRELRKVYWLDFKGERRQYGELKPDGKMEQSTFLGHPWLVTDGQDNALGLYYPDGQKRVVILEN